MWESGDAAKRNAPAGKEEDYEGEEQKSYLSEKILASR